MWSNREDYFSEGTANGSTFTRTASVTTPLSANPFTGSTMHWKRTIVLFVQAADRMFMWLTVSLMARPQTSTLGVGTIIMTCSSGIKANFSLPKSAMILD